MKIVPAIALSILLTGCIQSTPVKPVVEPEDRQTTAMDVTKSCLNYGRYVVRYFDDDLNQWIYVTFACSPMFKSKHPPKPPEVEQKDYLGPEAIRV
jgi:major membrane immunogen (membrane-anchored lipoprotein)